MGWSHIGGPAEEVYDAPLDEQAVLYKTEPNTGNISILTPHDGWRIIGGSGSMSAVSQASRWVRIALRAQASWACSTPLLPPC